MTSRTMERTYDTFYFCRWKGVKQLTLEKWCTEERLSMSLATKRGHWYPRIAMTPDVVFSPRVGTIDEVRDAV